MERKQDGAGGEEPSPGNPSVVAFATHEHKQLRLSVSLSLSRCPPALYLTDYREEEENEMKGRETR